MKRSLIITSLLVSTLVLGACGTMGDRDGARRGHHHGGHDAMRQASIAACEGKSEGASVKLSAPDGKEISAVCMKSPKDLEGKLHAMPEQMVARMNASKDACVGKSEVGGFQRQHENH